MLEKDTVLYTGLSTYRYGH